MPRRTIVSVLKVLTLLLIAHLMVPDRLMAAPSSDEEGIRKASNAYAEAFNKADIDGVLAVWAPESEYIDEAGKSTKGRDALRAMFKKIMDENKGMKVQIKTTWIRFVKDDVAISDGSAVATIPNGDTNANPFTAVWTKKDGQWLLQILHDGSEKTPDEGAAGQARLKELGWLIGDWSHEEKDVKRTISVRWMKGEKFLMLDYAIRKKDSEVVSISQIIGWDPTSDRLHSWTFDTSGGFSQGYLSRSGKKWSADVSGVTADGQNGSSIDAWKFVDDNSFVWEAVDRELGGQPLPDVKITYQRQKSK